MTATATETIAEALAASEGLSYGSALGAVLHLVPPALGATWAVARPDAVEDVVRDVEERVDRGEPAPLHPLHRVAIRHAARRYRPPVRPARPTLRLPALAPSCVSAQEASR